METAVYLITGQHGTSHEKVADTLCNIVNEKEKSDYSISVAKSYSLDKEIWSLAGSPEVFFEWPDDKKRDDVWIEAFLKIQDKIKKDNPLFAFISLHVVYLWKKRFFSCVDWDHLITIQPKVILTLIDDIYDIHTRVVNSQKAHGAKIPKGSYNLFEILSWRLREIHTCNLIAKHLFVNPECFPYTDRFIKEEKITRLQHLHNEIKQVFGKPLDHFVVSIKQSPQEFYKLLFERKKLKIYLSFPISEPRRRDDKAYFKQLRKWRHKMHQNFISFDPSAIDELRFNENEKGKIITGRLKDRIPYQTEPPIVNPPIGVPDSWPLKELQTIRDFVSQQVSERDYKLESQSDLIVMWRPLYGKKNHTGVEAEAVFAKAKGIPIHSYHPSEDQLLADKPFHYNIGSNHDTESELLKAIHDFQKKREKNQK